jgi:hypothetical protein
LLYKPVYAAGRAFLKKSVQTGNLFYSLLYSKGALLTFVGVKNSRLQ